MTLTIYGPPMSRAMRTLWMAHELGLDFRHEYGFQEHAPVPTEDLVAASPMGQVPAINDDGFTLSESMAINIYLAKKHGKLAPVTPEDEAQTLRWSFWVMTAVEIALLDVLFNARGLRGRKQDPGGCSSRYRGVAKTLQCPERRVVGPRLPAWRHVQRRRS